MENFVARLPEIVAQLVAFAVAISVHESAHGLAAEKLGDPTARWLGRITLNPIKHIDPFGTILFPLFLAALGAPVLGWAKPVPFVTRNLRDQKWGPALLALAGPASNVVFGTAVITVLMLMKVGMADFRPLLFSVLKYGAAGAPGVVAPLVYLLFALAMINVVLAVFNLIPIPPLDGSHLLYALLPPGLRAGYGELSRYGMVILFVLLWVGAFGLILKPFVNGLIWLLLG